MGSPPSRSCSFGYEMRFAGREPRVCVDYHHGWDQLPRLQGVLVDEAERESIAKDLGSNKIMFLRNHGLVVLGSSVEEAFVRIYHVILACEAQVRMMSAGLDNLTIISDAVLQSSFAKVRSAAEFAAKGMMKEKMAATATKYSEIIKKKTQVNWAIGDMDYEAYMRLLDSAGYRTGYEYKLPNIKILKE